MSPLGLKIKGNRLFSPFADLDSEEDLSKTWRVCTKVKDAIENGSRFENLLWRLWFREHFNSTLKKVPFKKLTYTTAQRLNNQSSRMVPFDKTERPTSDTAMRQKDSELNAAQQERSPVAAETTMGTDALQLSLKAIPTSSSAAIEMPEYDRTSSSMSGSAGNVDSSFSQKTFVLNQFTSDQASDQMVVLDDIFGSLGLLLPTDAIDSVVATTPRAIVHGDNIRNEIEFSTQWDLNELDMSINIHEPQLDPTQVQLQYPVASMIPDEALTVSRLVVSPTQQGHPNMSYSVPSSPAYCYQQSQNTLDYFGFNSWQTSPNMSPLSVQSQDDNRMNSSQIAGGSPTHLYHTHSTDLTAPSLCASVSTLAFSVTSPSGSSPKVTDQMSCDNTLPRSFLSINQQTSDGSHDQQLHLMYATTPSSSVFTPFSRPKKTTASATGNGERTICSNCGATSTPLWRRSVNDKLLCNACGLYQKLHNSPRPKTLKSNNGGKDLKEEEAAQLACSNCSTTTTPLWRRDEAGSPLCNACGLYFRIHHENRPLSMKTDIIRKRQRYESGNSNDSNNNNNANGGNSGVRKPSKKKSNSQHSPPLERSVSIARQSYDSVFLFNSQNSTRSSALSSL